ncbi:MAG: methyltransferase domain-containing protein [Candidatus Diapherotrites archaeon]|nr:methyltransferase domain-containing protein [Candidatus Diapherotrites archaeon]
MPDSVKRFYESFPYPSKPIFSRKNLFKNAQWISRLAGMEPDSFPEGSRILEAGCGTGEFSCGFALSPHARVMGVDVSSASLQIARRNAEKFGLMNVSFESADVLKLPFESGSFDYVFSLGCIHHTQNPRKAFSELCRVTRPGGVVVVGVYHAWGRLRTRLAGLLLSLAVADEEKRLSLAHKWFSPQKTFSAQQRIWLADKYLHPLEHHLLVNDLRQWFAQEGLEFEQASPAIQKPLSLLNALKADLSFGLRQESFMVLAGRKA